VKDEAPKDVWDKMQAVAGLAASVLIPLAVAWVGNGYNKAIKDSENSVKYVELAITILRAEPTEGNESLKAWAVEVVNNHAAIKLSPEAQAELRKRLIVYDAGYASTQYKSGYASASASAPKK
jgi:hypothetical protein